MEELGDWPCGGRTPDEHVLAAAMAMAERMAGAGRLNPSTRRACIVAARVALAMRASLSSMASLCRAATTMRAAWSATFPSVGATLRPLLLVVSQASSIGDSSFFGFFFFGVVGRGRGSSLDGGGRVLRAVAMEGAGG